MGVREKMQSSIISELQKEFIAEAKGAPKLFRDLGKVEQYIAESYKTRSFIELIQNADDANSSIFGIYSIDNMLVVANDGRPFTGHDIESLCRSGSSNKNRGGITIGYRGIGFKSVVNLARRIFIFSNDFKFYFDKVVTQKLLLGITELPLIRIPHPFDAKNDSHNIVGLLEKLVGKHTYTTFFIFCDIDYRVVQQELQDFDRNSLLFLNNISRMICHVDSIQREILITKQNSGRQRLVEIKEGGKSDNWEILTSPKDPRDMIAFKVDGDTIIPATQEESVVHSFTPTIEFVGACIKINGDYSTDPSRKNIDFDDFSLQSLDNVLTLLVDTIVEVLEGKSTRKGFFSPFVNGPNIEGNKFKIRFHKVLTEKLRDIKININGKKVAYTSLRSNPDWLNYEDYQKVCIVDIQPVPMELLKTHPNLPAFLELIGVEPLYLKDVLKTVNDTVVSTTGAAQITTKLINQFRFDMTKEKVAEISKLKLFPKGNRLVTPDLVETTDELKEDFLRFITNHVEASDLRHFFQKTGIIAGESLQSNDYSKPSRTIDTPIIQPSNSTSSGINSIFKSTPELKKWRSAEKNAAEYLKSLKCVLTVNDVSMANMGYDLEIILENGGKIFVEVKSVRSFNDPIKITNNEYSSAHNHGTAYYLAIVINEEPFQIKLVSDPIENLLFQKQIERWSWLCENYSSQAKSVNNLNSGLL